MRDNLTQLLIGSAHKRKTAVVEWVLLILLVCGYYIWLSNGAIYSASTNGRLVDRFETDEYQLFYVTNEALVGRTLFIDWSVYGHFYFNLALIPLFLMDFFAGVSEQTVILTLRYISLISSALTVVLTFGIARRFFSRPAAWMSALFLAVIPSSFNLWSIKIHPDTLQMFMVVACLFAASEFVASRKKGWLLIASIFAGMSFSTKYVGVFLMPIIWLFYFLSLNEKKGEKQGFSFDLFIIKPWVKFCVTTGLVFLIAFIVTSPSLLVGGQMFNGLFAQMKYTRAGYIFAANNHFYEWFSVLSSPAVLGMINSLLLGTALVLFLSELWRKGIHIILSCKGLLWTWVLVYFLYAVVNVNLRIDRYLLVIIPSAFILISQFVVDAFAWMLKNVPKKTVFYILLFGFLVFEGIAILRGFSNQRILIETTIARETGDLGIEAGHWLEANYKPSTRILHDRYMYIPPKFEKVQGSYGMDLEMLLAFQPRVVVINHSIRDVYLDPSLADSFTEGAEKYMAIHDFYEQMENEELGYHLVAEFGGIKIFEKDRD